MSRLTTITALCTLCAAVFLFAFVLARSLWWSPESDISVPFSQVDSPIVAATSSLPVRLSIPSLGIDAKVQYVGVAKSGNMAVPNNFTDVGWYRGGVVPGSQGSAVMDGHVDNALALPGVFKRLADIKMGDSVYVERKDGTALRFVVYDMKEYPYTSVPMGTVFASTSAANLNLITCDGSWIQSRKTYDTRLVVYARLQEG